MKKIVFILAVLSISMLLASCGDKYHTLTVTVQTFDNDELGYFHPVTNVIDGKRNDIPDADEIKMMSNSYSNAAESIKDSFNKKNENKNYKYNMSLALYIVIDNKLWKKMKGGDFKDVLREAYNHPEEIKVYTLHQDLEDFTIENILQIPSFKGLNTVI